MSNITITPTSPTLPPRSDIVYGQCASQVVDIGANAYDDMNPESAVGGLIIDRHHPQYAKELSDHDVLGLMFGVFLVKNRRGVWRLQNAVF